MRASTIGVCGALALLAACDAASGEEGDAPPGTLLGVQVQAADEATAARVTGFSIRVWRDGDEAHPFFQSTRALRPGERLLTPPRPQEIVHPRTRAGDERVVVEAALLRGDVPWVVQRARLRFVPTWALRLYLTLNGACVDRSPCPEGQTCGGDGACASIDRPVFAVWRPRGALAPDASTADASTDAASDGSAPSRDAACDGAACDGELSHLVAGGDTTCAQTRGGAVSCWGANLWDATEVEAPRSAVPRAVRVPSLDGARSISMERSLCAVTASGAVRCSPARALPSLFRGLTSVRSVVVGRAHACALLDDATVRCAGENGLGQCGERLTQTPQNLASVDGLARADGLHARGDLSCAISEGSLSCWGTNRGGLLSADVGVDPSIVSCAAGDACRGSAAPMSGLTGVRRVATVHDPSSALTGLGCALDDLGAVRCWGQGIVTDGAPGPALASPGAVVEALVADDVQGGEGFACALTRAGGVSCWGRADGCRLGRSGAAGEVVARPVAVPLAGARAIAVGRGHACALLSGSRVVCWGDASMGQLGHGGLVAPDGCGPVEVLR